MSAPAIALLLDHGLIDQWPFEVTARGRAFIRSAPSENIYFRALHLGDDSGIIVNNVTKGG